jgi:hypothetical protein
MTKYLAGVLTAIAAGVLLVAYALLSPRASASFGNVPYAPVYAYQFGQPQPAVQYMQPVPAYPQQPAVTYPPAYSATPIGAVPVSMAQPVRALNTVELERPTPRRLVRTPIDRSPGRNWKKTAMVIGGSSAAGAGIGAIVGGKKGALIGAAIGGGASTLYETTKGR